MALLPAIRSLIGLGRRSLESGEPGVEGKPKTGPWLVNGGWLPAEAGFWNFWQMDLDPIPISGNAIVEACVAAYAQTIAQCPGDHWRATGDGGRERVTTSALSRILRRPNEYQSRSDFIMKMAADLYRSGNAYALAVRNDRFEVQAFHVFNPTQSHPIVDGQGNVFYELIGNNVIDRQYSAANYGPLPSSFQRGVMSTSVYAPARDVLHIKLENKPGEPLVGIPPSRHAADAIAAQNAIGQQLTKSLGSMNRPSGVIETDKNLTADQTKELRTALDAHWRGVDNLSAGPPVLMNGLKFHAISNSAKDAEVLGTIKLTQDEIFMVYGIPPAILGLTDKSSFASTEALVQFWLVRGLGFAIDHIEVAFDHFFGLKSWPDEYVEFDTRALLRVAYKDRIEALARGVQTAIYTPNEARRTEDLPDKPGGNDPRVQQQQVPLDWGGFEFQPPAPPAAPAPDKPSPDDEDDPDDEAVEPAKFMELWQAEVPHRERKVA